MRFRNVSLLAVVLTISLASYAATPQVANTNPTSGAAGTLVQINGSGFGATQGSSTVAFNGVKAAVTSWSDTQIVANVPSAATTGPVTVTVGGVASNYNVSFSVPRPQVTSIAPATGIVGTQVTAGREGDDFVR